MSYTPLADALRPSSFDEMVGQTHLFGKNGSVRRMAEQGYLPNMVFFGPPGTGKTTAAGILAKHSGKTIRRLNATTDSLADVKAVCSETASLFGSGGILLYLDEIQYFNKKQQQSLLSYLEDGRITLIASTTENPYLYVYNAILSRSAVYEFRSVSAKELIPALKRGMDYLNRTHEKNIGASDEALFAIASAASGDVRRSLNLLENAYFASDEDLTPDSLTNLGQVTGGNFDKDGTVHYDLLSALQKSIRGSDPDAAIFYLARILTGGDLIGACRRLSVIASEDIGLAYPQAAAITEACVSAAFRVGLPEASIPLSNAAIMLATAPKSNAAHIAYEKAAADVAAGKGQNIPTHLRQTTQFDGYKYPHDFPDHYVKQQYLPDDLKNTHYYTPAPNKTEQAAALYWKTIKEKKN